MRFSGRVCLLFSFSLVSSWCFVCATGEEEGDRCDFNGSTETSGICTKVVECPPAIEAVRYRGSHKLKRCGFDGLMEIVCCPEEDLNLIPSHLSSTSSPRTPVRPDNPNGGGDGRENKENPGGDHTETRAPHLGKRKCSRACDHYINETKPLITYHIIDGEDASPGEFPHMVALGYVKPDEDEVKWNCGGTLISERYVLTAAHCIINVERVPPKIARMGVLSLAGPFNGSDPLDVEIENITIHPDYKWSQKLNDIALIKLKRDVKFTKYISPACLYTKDDDPIGLIVTGWGLTSDAGEMATILQKASLLPVPLNECNVTLLTRTRKPIVNTQICATGANNKSSDACQGDSGGPLQVQNNVGSTVFNLVGVTSYGISCGGKYPGIYTRVSEYLEWIEENVWPDNDVRSNSGSRNTLNSGPKNSRLTNSASRGSSSSNSRGSSNAGSRGSSRPRARNLSTSGSRNSSPLGSEESPNSSSESTSSSRLKPSSNSETRDSSSSTSRSLDNSGLRNEAVSRLEDSFSDNSREKSRNSAGARSIESFAPGSRGLPSSRPRDSINLESDDGSEFELRDTPVSRSSGTSNSRLTGLSDSGLRDGSRNNGQPLSSATGNVHNFDSMDETYSGSNSESMNKAYSRSRNSITSESSSFPFTDTESRSSVFS